MIRFPSLAAQATLAAAAVSLSLSLALPADAAPLRPDHPLIGTWILYLTSQSCEETYVIREDGSTVVWSGQEISESVSTFDDKPRPTGFFRWDDKIVKDNGKPDCQGQVMDPGGEITNYIKLDSDGETFVMCRQENLNECLGPLVRQPRKKI